MFQKSPLPSVSGGKNIVVAFIAGQLRKLVNITRSGAATIFAIIFLEENIGFE